MSEIRIFGDGIVSIHTPTQGVTRKSGEGYTYSHVSIHTPTQGVTKRNEQY